MVLRLWGNIVREQLVKLRKTVGEFAVFILIMIAMFPVLNVDGWADKTFGPYWPLCLIVIVSTVGLMIVFFHERRKE
jgi:hypothetical protein